jgi:hypothetical protein
VRPPCYQAGPPRRARSGGARATADHSP